VRFAGEPDWAWLADFHLLLFISDKLMFDMDNDMAALVRAIRQRGAPGAPKPLIHAIKNYAGVKLTLQDVRDW
jgi:hypothetical protein